MPTTGLRRLHAAWDRVARGGYRHYNLDTWASGRRYLSLATLDLTQAEAYSAAELTQRFTRPARPRRRRHPGRSGLVAGARLAVARDRARAPGTAAPATARPACSAASTACSIRAASWQVIEYNADTPSGGREASGLEPAIARLYPVACAGSRPASPSRRRASWWLDCEPPGSAWSASCRRIAGTRTCRRRLWLTALLRRAGQPALVRRRHRPGRTARTHHPARAADRRAVSLLSDRATVSARHLRQSLGSDRSTAAC